MKNLIRIGLALFGSVIVGITLFWLLVSQRGDLVAADQPNAARSIASPWDRRQQPLRPLAINESQILLHTTIVDINREKMAKAGIGFGMPLPRQISGQQPSGAFSIVSRREADLFAKLLATGGMGKILAEPTIVTNDGRTARFRSGGEFPMVVPRGKDTVSVEYRQFGTSIDFLPKKLADGKLRLEISVGQTDLDHTKSIQVKGAQVPGLKTRVMDSVVELEAGKTAMLHGDQLLVIVTPEFVAAAPKTHTVPRPARQVNELPFRAGMDISMIADNALMVKFEHKIPQLTVENDGVIEAHPTDPNRVLITAKLPGKTKLTVWDEKSESLTIPIHVVGKALPAPPRTAQWAKQPTGPASITAIATIYSFDRHQLRDSGVDVYEMLEESESSAAVDAGELEGESDNAIVSVMSPRTIARLNRRLSETKGAHVLSRPQIRTTDGQAAQVQVGSHVPIKGSGDVQQTSAKFHVVGVTLELVPTLKGDQIQLQARAEHSKLNGAKLESIRLAGVAELYLGETLAICQNDDENEQLLFLVTPVATSRGATSASPSKTPFRNSTLLQKQRDVAAAKLSQLKNHFGPKHPQVLEQTQKLTAFNELTRQKGNNHVPKEDLLAQFGETIQHAFPDAKIRLHPMPNGILLSGTVSDSQHVEVLSKIAENYFPQVINNVAMAKRSASSAENSAAGPKDLPTVVAELFPGTNIEIYPLHNSVVLTGNIDAASAAQVIRVAEDYYPSVINHLTELGTPRQAGQTVPAIPVDAPRRQSSDSLDMEMRELRKEVKVLRRDVRKLIEILQTQADNSDSEDPPQADAQSSNAAAEVDGVMWELIGVRATPADLPDSRYRGGLRITEVRPNSPAAKERIRTGDVLVGLDKWETIDRSNIGFVLDRVKDTERLKFYLLRGKETLYGHLDLNQRPKSGINEGAKSTVPADDSEPESSWNLSLNNAIDIALRNAKTIRHLGLAVSDNASDRVFFAKTDADVDVHQFEVAVKNLLSGVEDAYWDVWVAQREVETYQEATDKVQALYLLHEANQGNVRDDKGSQAAAETRPMSTASRSQLKAAVAKLSSREQKLRYLMGLSNSDGRQIRATDQPSTSPLNLNWKVALADALANSAELGQHRSTVQSLELQLTAAKNVLPSEFASNLESFTDQTFAITSPFDSRRELAKLRNLELRIARDYAQLREMEAEISNSLAEAIQELNTMSEELHMFRNRLKAARTTAKSEAAAYEAGDSNADKLLTAYRQVTESTLGTHEATKRFAIAAKDVRLLQGLLLKDRGVRFVQVGTKTGTNSSDRFRDEAQSPRIPDPTLALKPNDRLTIESLADKKLNRNVTILSDGTITLPLLGQVAAAGLSLERQREELESLYKKYYRSPNLTLSFYGTSVRVDAETPNIVLDSAHTAPNPKANLKAGDRLLLECQADTRFNRQITVLADGTVTLPMLGQVPTSGRTLTTLNEQLTGRYEKHFKDPQCTLSFLGTSLPAR